MRIGQGLGSVLSSGQPYADPTVAVSGSVQVRQATNYKWQVAQRQQLPELRLTAATMKCQDPNEMTAESRLAFLRAQRADPEALATEHNGGSAGVIPDLQRHSA
jgi:hypothetical protein